MNKDHPVNRESLENQEEKLRLAPTDCLVKKDRKEKLVCTVQSEHLVVLEYPVKTVSTENQEHQDTTVTKENEESQVETVSMDYLVEMK